MLIKNVCFYVFAGFKMWQKWKLWMAAPVKSVRQSDIRECYMWK
jgi:hypothetical protein